MHFSLVAALHKWATQSSTHKLPVCTVLDQNGRPAVSLTYGLFFVHFTHTNTIFVAKLLSRSTKLAHYLVHKLHSQSSSGKVPALKPGDRVALVYPNNDPINFSIAFYACLMAGLLPVAIEVPLSKRVRHCHYYYLHSHTLYYRMLVCNKLAFC